MNCGVSFFKFYKDGGRLRLYPEGETLTIYERAVGLSDSKTTIVVHRRGSLMYYNYVFRVDGRGDAFGISVLLNGAMITDFGGLFGVFDNAAADAAIRGKMLRIKDSGEISLGDDEFDFGDAERMEWLIRSEIEGLDRHTRRLPVVEYSIGEENVGCFDFKKDDEREIVQVVPKYPYTIIKKDEFAAESLSDISGTLAKAQREKDGLREEVRKVRREKKRMAFLAVVPWFLIVSAVGVVYFNYYADVQKEKQELLEEEKRGLSDKVNGLRGEMASMEGAKAGLEGRVAGLERAKSGLESENAELRRRVSELGDDNERMKKKAEMLAESNEKLKQRVAKLSEERNRFQEKAKSLGTEIEKQKVEMRRLTSENLALRSRAASGLGSGRRETRRRR